MARTPVGRSAAAAVAGIALLAGGLSGPTAAARTEPSADDCMPVDSYRRTFVSPRHGGGVSDAGDRFGAVLTAADFDADGYADVVAGSPSDGVGTAGTGAVYVFHGSATGTGAGRRLDQAMAAGANEAGDQFGAALATGDFDADGYADLAVGAPGEDLGGISDSGAVFVFHGGAAGLTGGRWIDQGPAGGANEAGDGFGSSLVAADLTADGGTDLAVGVPGEALRSEPRGGAVAVLRGSATGLGTGFFRSQTDAAGLSEAGDRFGAAVAAGDVTGDGTADLVVGAPVEAPNGDPAAGAVFVLPGPGLTGGYVRTQTDARGANEAGDRFGAALATGDLDGDGRAEIVAGAPGEDVAVTGTSTAADAGAVFVLGSTGYLLTGYAGGDIPEPGDALGTAVSAADLGGDGYADLAAGAPGEGPDAEPGTSGAVYLFGGRAGLPDTGRRIAQTDVHAAGEAGDRFGAALVSAWHPGSGRTDLVVGATGEALDGYPPAGAIAVVSGLSAGVSIGGLVGAVSDTGARIWARGAGPGELRVRYRAAGTTAWSTSSAVRFDPDRDRTATVELSGLTPGTGYEYRLVVGCAVDPLTAGRFRTAEPAGTPGTVRFVYGADLQHPSVFGRSFAAMDQLATTNPDFAILGGDQMYADHGTPATTLAGYYAKYRENWSQSHLRRFLGNHPTLMMWDDHEIRNDWSAGSAPPYPAARTAYDAYQGSHNPAPRAPGQLYYTYQAGQADFFVLDTRSHRSPNGAPDDDAKTMLGSAQKADLKAWLSGSTAAFKFIVTSVPFNDFGTTGNDSWRGFTTERAELFDHIRQNAIGGVVLLAGDQHWSAAVRLAGAGAPLYEFMPTPLAAGARTPPPPGAGVLWLDQERRQAFGVFDIDSTVSPARLTVEYRTHTNQLMCRIRIDATGALLGTDAC